MPPRAYDQLAGHVRETFLLTSTSALLSWDQETGMPPAAGQVRAEQLALLARLAHARATDPRVGDWLLACEQDRALRDDPGAVANVRELRRDFDRATRLPPALVAELAEVASLAQQQWAQARAAADFARFRPWLERMLQLQQQQADCLAVTGQCRFDALADLYERGMNLSGLQTLFAPLRQRLVALRQRLLAGKAPHRAFAKQAVAEGRQEAFVRAVLAAFGFDPQRGRLDRSAHPFCTSTGGDVRLTTRFRTDNVLDALGSTMHEGGHGLYEQGLPLRHLGTPLGEAVSLGIHESQSRLWENHVGRSRGFWQWARPLARQHLGEVVDGFSATELWREQNCVEPGLIRVEADECTYDLHVMVRFEIETALLHGQLAVADLPACWNAKYRDHLGVTVPDDARGCLQDVHWSCGLFGYFPTYTLGNLYAAQLFAAAARQLGDLDAAFARGEFAPLRQWLQQQVHAHGRRYPPGELCERATGAPLSPEPFLHYLEQKLVAVYEL